MSLPIETDCQAVQTGLEAGPDFLLLDCREPDEWETARIDGATLIPLSELQDRLDELEPHRQQAMVVHCHHGVRSLQVAHWLRGQGFPQAQSMAGGIDEWSRTVDERIPRY